MADGFERPAVARLRESTKILIAFSCLQILAIAFARPSVQPEVMNNPGYEESLDPVVAKGYRLGMSQPVKLSDELVCDARQIAALTERSIAGQIELWAQLGRTIEPLLRGDRVIALRQAGRQSLSSAIDRVHSDAGRRRVYEFLAQRPYPHFEAVPDRPGLLKRIDEDGTETHGRFVNRRFVPES